MYAISYKKKWQDIQLFIETRSQERLLHGIRFPMRGLWRVERHQRGRNRRPPAELRRRLPGLLQAQCPSGGIRYVVAVILYDSVFGVSRQHLRAFLCDLRD